MNLYLLRRNKPGGRYALAVLSILVFSLSARAQLRDHINLPDHDDKFYHLGIALIYNTSHFQVESHPSFLQNDSVLSVNPENTGGFGLAGMMCV